MRFVGMAAAAAALCMAGPAAATYSIVACNAEGDCGVAVSTNNLAVGATVIYAQAGIGAVASQFETNPSYGPKGLALLQKGASAEAVVGELIATDDGFEGQDSSYRQVGVVGVSGKGASHTGSEAAGSPWSGAETGPGFSIQGNGLAGPSVVQAMRDAFLRSSGSLADRLLSSIEAGEAAGGQTTGKLSAALLVRTREGGFQDIDLRVDASGQPVTELRRLLGLRQANDALVRAERAARKGQTGAARAQLSEAIHLGSGWDRVWRRAARLQMRMGDEAAALQALAALASVNPTWGRLEADDQLYADLWKDPAAAKWRADIQPR